MDIGDLWTNLFPHAFFIATKKIIATTIICKDLT